MQNKPDIIYVTERSENTPGQVDSGWVDSGADLTSGRVDPLPQSVSQISINKRRNYSHPAKNRICQPIARLIEYLHKSNAVDRNIEFISHYLLEYSLYENERENLRRKLFETCGIKMIYLFQYSGLHSYVFFYNFWVNHT